MVLFVLGVGCLVMWPVSYWWSISGGVLISDGERLAREWPFLGTASKHLTFTQTLVLVIESGRINLDYGNADWVGGSFAEPVGEEHAAVGIFARTYQPTVPRLEWWCFEVSSPHAPSPFASRILARLPLPLTAAALLSPGLLWFIPYYRRRRRVQYRLASDLCLHCGYPWRGSVGATCPECGAARPMVTVW